MKKPVKSLKTKGPTATLAIPTYNRESVLLDTLRSALKLKHRPEEILVVDQTPEHEKETENFLKAAQRKGLIRWLKQGPPSLTAARNRAIAEAKSDVLIFIDDDVELPKDFVARHLHNYRKEEVQAVGGGVIQENKPHFPKRPGGWPRLLDYKYFSIYEQKRTKGVATFMGCNHSVRTEVLRKLGGYDSHYIGSAFREDTDMAVRIWKSGGTIVFDPGARLTHWAAPSGGCRIPSERKSNPEWWVPFNRHYFAFRHLFPTLEFWKSVFFVDFRQTVLRKANLFRPWKIPGAFLSYLYSMFKAAFLAFKKNWRERRA